MALRKSFRQTVLQREFNGCLECSRRLYCTKVDLMKLLPMILDRIDKRGHEYSVRAMDPVTVEVLKVRNVLIQDCMALRKNLWKALQEFNGCLECPRRLYRTKVGLRKLRPMILDKIDKRSHEYPVHAMVPVAVEVLKARNVLIQGVSILLKSFPVVACKFCPEIYIGEKGHLIHTCRGYKLRAKNRVHEWVTGGLHDVLVPVEAFHLNKFQGVIKHNQRFDFDRIPAVVELCWQAGANPNAENLDFSSWNWEAVGGSFDGTESLSPLELAFVANKTFTAWETVRSGVQKLLFAYSAKVCKYCSEVHVGPSGHKARLCGVFKYESWRGIHFWMKAEVDDLVPPKFVWRRRLQDPSVLVDGGKGYYGRVPAVLELCSQAGAIVPAKYNYMMKEQGLSGPAQS